MVIWNILLSIFVALWSFGCVVERKRNEVNIRKIEEEFQKTNVYIRIATQCCNDYTDQAVLAHEKMAHEGYENYTTEGKVIG